jgi:hypothetical protein
MIEEVVFERGDEVAALVKRSESGSDLSSPELSFEAADEPHGLVAIQQGEEKEGDERVDL